MPKSQYYTLDKILEYNADYNVIYGERSNGKTTAVLHYFLKEFCSSNYKRSGAVIRRWDEDFKGGKAQDMVSGIIALGWIEKYTKKEYNSCVYKGGKWYLVYVNKDTGDTTKILKEPFLYAFAISQGEHYKSTAYPNIFYILFDEFITREYYLPDEFVKFQNLLSTIIRLRDDIKIFMCGNTVNKYNPYFSEMGICNAKTQKIGTIDIYTYGESTLKVAVEYSTMGDKKAKKSNKYFAFNNPKLKMITNGAWEIDIYPHLPVKYIPKDIRYTYFIQFDEITLQCEIIHSRELKDYFTYIHLKTTDIQEDNTGIVFNQTACGNRYYRRKITVPYDEIGRKIWEYFRKDKVFYQNNEIGEVVNNYLMWCSE